ncbi:Asp23/Gls24 family envelope stress response protein [Enterococcus dongliensis]|uniref:Asp23/Gls24 family envelope stress response protein n=1 Tax=Enterococcus dongliensis TaxID=2559925 RepID=UPI002890A775|nr:Asp23/Gls24 family envelope stress response protein [Enterococcus dongliensis]MDT2641072.1 Asp23/Gls24 family envelope stress response protein [Enterococcus dongliensis]
MEKQTGLNTSQNEHQSILKGDLTYKDKVIQKIIGTTVKNIDGLLTVDGGAFSNAAEKLVNTENTTSGINTEVGEKQVAVDMDIVVEYGKDIPKIAEEIRQVIHDEVKNMTHLDVVEVNLCVADIKSREEYETDSETVQDKMTDAAKTAGHFTSDKTEKAKEAISQKTDTMRGKVKENTEP